MPFANKEKAKEYHKKYHLKTWSNRKNRHLQLKTIRRAKLSAWLKQYKHNLACIDCKESHPACLDFHHLNEKNNTIANMISEGYAIKSIQAEISKCIILCRNCHAKRHYKESS